MIDSTRRFELPPQVNRHDGRPRLVGFELEFSGIDLDDTVAALRSALGGEIQSESAAERSVQVDALGEFTVELDWAYLKRKAAETKRIALEKKLAAAKKRAELAKKKAAAKKKAPARKKKAAVKKAPAKPGRAAPCSSTQRRATALAWPTVMPGVRSRTV